MRRPGISLLEVLSAIFITGIGLLSLLTLFPLGALKMAESLQDDRAAQAAASGQSIANAVVMRLDASAQSAMLNLPLAEWQVVPNPPPLPFPNNVSPAAADATGYPVLVDPIGAFSYTGVANWQQWVAGTTQGIPRVRGQWLRTAPGDTSTAQALLRWCTVQDDLNFINDGAFQGLTADPPSWVPGGGGVVQRYLNFSYAWMLRMPRAGAPNVVDVSVLVFRGRSLDFVGFGTQEQAYTAVFNASANTVAIYPAAGAAEPPSLRKGQWILDASMQTVPANPPNLTPVTLVASRGFFYRIVSVSDTLLDTNGNQYVSVEVQTSLRGWTLPGNAADPAFTTIPPGQIPAGQPGTVVIFDNLVEVFDDGTF
jgi:hypothetical protein